MGACCSWFFKRRSGNIHRAAKFGDLRKVTQIVEEGVSVDCRDWSGETPLHKAVKRNKLEVIHFLVNRNCDLNLRNWKGLTPVAQAAKNYRKEIVLFLLQCGADVNCSVRKPNFTLLHQACQHGWADVVQSIVQRENADLNAVGGIFGETPLMIVLKKHHYCCTTEEKRLVKEIAGILIRAGADVNKSDSRKKTALHHASAEGDNEMVELLVGVDSLNINLQDNLRYTALHWASWHGNNEVVKLLVGVDSLNINLQAEFGYTALHLASSGGNYETVKLLLGADSLNINFQDDRGDTLLHWACLMGYRQVSMELVKAGADTTIKNNIGRLAVCMGIRGHTLNINDIKLFVEHGFFFEDNFFWELSYLKRTLKQTVLKDVDLCTQAIVNKYNHQSLPALYRNLNVARRLPAMKKMNLKPQQIRQVINFVESDIETNTYCHVVKARPNVLQMLCVETLIKGQE